MTTVAVMALGACSPAGDSASSPPASTESPAASTTRPSSPRPSSPETSTEQTPPNEEQEKVPFPVVDGNAGVVPSEEFTSDGLGEYNQMTLADDSPLFSVMGADSFEPTLNDLHTPTDLNAAQEFASLFMVEQFLDSKVAFNNTDPRGARETWISEEMGSYVQSEYESYFVDAIRTESASILLGSNPDATQDDGSNMRGSAVYGGVRYSSVDAKINNIWDAGDGDIGFGFDLYTIAPVENPLDPTDSIVYDEHQRARFDIALQKSEQSWGIVYNLTGLYRITVSPGDDVDAKWAEAEPNFPETLEGWEDPRS